MGEKTSVHTRVRAHACQRMRFCECTRVLAHVSVCAYTRVACLSKVTQQRARERRSCLEGSTQGDPGQAGAPIAQGGASGAEVRAE